ncbi:MAG: isoleucine--tRNA ligase [Candidatus Aenigmarchaeota archaeon]|nr:isoleucine--tRNA ligase [Candidatus Aenigmarchaeota archaeon]
MRFYDPKTIESRIRKFWEDNNLPRKIVEDSLKNSKKIFYLLDGPPYVNQIPHVGHIKTTTLKDVWSKFKLMQGFGSWFQPGFDCHGLPIENMVERELKISSKKEIEKMGVDKFIEVCREHAKGNEKAWLEIYKKLGAWRGYFEPYMTFYNYYIESAWWAFKKMAERGMLYEGEKPTYWCPRCETALAGYEVTDSYAEIKDPYIYVKFPIKGRKDEYIVIFTTTPWTLVGNVAIAVHPDENYAKVKVGKEILILAEKRVEAVLKELCGVENYEILEIVKGKELEGLEYEPVLKVPLQKKLAKEERGHRIILSIPVLKSKAYSKAVAKGGEKGEEEVEEFVNAEEGSGAVHTAPGHGPEDYYVGVYYKLPMVSPVDESGKFTEESGKFKGLFVKDAEELILEELRKSNYLLYEGYIVHSYPLCWRCKTPLIFRLSKQWFLSIEPIKKKMLEENEKVKWLPGLGRERFENWLKQAIDWCISRQRYWGIPIPIWKCENCGKIEVIGSVKELREKALGELAENIDLHKHVVDKIVIKCEECGGKMKRIPDILDVWFDSGVAPWASLGYPFKNKELFEKLWPVDMICEAQDQIRGWFYSLMFCGVGTFGESPYKAVSMMGWVVNKKGEKMSKSKGNVIWAEEAIEKYGADVLRLYYCWGKPPWEIQFFSELTIKEIRKYLNILWNVYYFFTIFKPKNFELRLEDLEIEDIWILSRLNNLVKDVTNALEEFEFHKAGKRIMEFVSEDLSKTYVKMIRDRVDIYADEKTKFPALSTLYICLINTSKLLAPISPFISEEIYKNLTQRTSVFMDRWPEVKGGLIDKELEENVKVAKKIIEVILRKREEQRIKLRWPLQEVYVSDVKIEKVKKFIEILANVKKVLVGEPENKEGFVVGEFENIKVYVPKELNEKMKKEAIVREIVRRVQESRKKNGFSIMEKISLYLSGNIEDLIEEFGEVIRKNVNAESIVFGELKGEYEGSFEVLGRKIEFKFSKVE